jgi:hypothetical protein
MRYMEARTNFFIQAVRLHMQDDSFTTEFIVVQDNFRKYLGIGHLQMNELINRVVDYIHKEISYDELINFINSLVQK